MSETVMAPIPTIESFAPQGGKWQREFQAFQQLLPQLLTSYPGKYVAIHDGKIVDVGEEKLPLALRVLSKIGNVDIHVGFVSTNPEPIHRSGIRHDLSMPGDRE